MAAPAMIVTIKRKRDETALPEFVLASKRPSLARLTLDDDASSAAQDGGTAGCAAAAAFASPPPQGSQATHAAKARGTRYRLVGTAFERGGPAVRADAAALTAAREQAAKAQEGVFAKDFEKFDFGILDVYCISI